MSHRLNHGGRPGREPIGRGGDPQAPRGKMTFEEFLTWADEDTWAEWVTGRVVMWPLVTAQHQSLVGFLLMVLGAYVERHLPGRIFGPGYLMRTGPELPARLPDVIFIARDHLDRVTQNFLDGPADLAIEILSSETVIRDRGEKRAEYEMGGVREYWLIDPENRRADFYRLDAEGRYQRMPPGPDGIYHSEIVPEFWLKVDWLWQEPLPPVLDILRELGLIP